MLEVSVPTKEGITLDGWKRNSCFTCCSPGCAETFSSQTQGLIPTLTIGGQAGCAVRWNYKQYLKHTIHLIVVKNIWKRSSILTGGYLIRNCFKKTFQEMSLPMESPS